MNPVNQIIEFDLLNQDEETTSIFWTNEAGQDWTTESGENWSNS